MEILRNYIAGEWVPHTGSNAPIEVFNPANEEVIALVPESSKEDVEQAVLAAKKAQKAWAAVAPKEKAALLRKVAQGLRDSEEELIDAAVKDIGCNLNVAKTMSVTVPANTFDDVAARIENFQWEEDNGEYITQRVPLGVVGAITPWNYPLHQISAKIAPALGTGNTVVLKPSEVAPLTAYFLAEIINEVGFPAGVFNMVSGKGQTVGEEIVTAKDVDMVTFTGSVPVGERIGQLCGQNIKKFTLELGGKSASIISPEADLQSGLKEAVFGLANNSGQTCSALTRIFVPRNKLAEAEELAKNLSENIVIGDPQKEGVRLGPVISKQQHEKVKSYIDIGLADGAKKITTNELPSNLENGYFIPYTIFSDVTNDMRIAQEEIFGPVLCLLPYDSLEEAITQANDSQYGLSAGVWAENREKAVEIANRLETGQVRINGGRFNQTAPFGGFKKSGLGRELGAAGLEEFLEYKVLLV